MGYLPGVMAQADPAVERNRTEPNRSAVCSFFEDEPKADMMPFVGASAIRLLESELLLFPFVIERAHRRIVVWPIKHHAAYDFDARAQCNRVGWKPAGRVHGAEDIFFAAHKSDVERISRNAGAGARHHRQGCQ